MDGSAERGSLFCSPVDNARSVFRALLGREPESKPSLEAVARLENLEHMIAAVAASEEHAAHIMRSPHGRDAAAVTAFIDNAVAEQICPWQHRSIKRDEALASMRRMNAEEFWICFFEIRDGRVTVVEKPPEIMESRPSNLIRAYQERATNFGQLIEDAAAFIAKSYKIDLVIYLGDEADDVFDTPIFSFQKNAGGINLLLPDFEIVGMKYMSEAPIDPLQFSEKVNRAAFAGSTTGGGSLVGIEQIRDHSRFPRLRAARYFKGCDEVDFRLPAIVQCTAEAKSALESEDFGHSPMHWTDSFSHKFVISIDGNGATCSRPAIILASNSVLMRYRSEYTLFWSSALIPWRHYIPVNEDCDVVSAVRTERNSPGRFKYISEEGRQFAELYLSRPVLLRYTAAIITAYYDLFS